MTHETPSFALVMRDLLDATTALRAVVGEMIERVEASHAAPRTITVADMCAATGLSDTTVRKLIIEGSLPGYKQGERYLIPDLEFDAWRRGEWRPRITAVQPVRPMVHSVPRTG